MSYVTEENDRMATDDRATLSQLDDNQLASSTLALADRIRPHLGLILLAAAVIFAVFAGLVIVRSQRAAEQAAGWEECLSALAEGEPGRLGDVAARYRGTPAAWWAELVLADTALADGNGLLMTDRQRARERLASAADLYMAVNAQRPSDLAAERGIFGLARTRESQGLLDEASRGYEAIVAEYPDSPFRGIAEERIAALALPATQRWYKWFETQGVAVAAPASPATPAGEPAAVGASEPPAPPESKPADPPSDTPSPTADPAASKPATEPASEPAASKPATSEPATEPAAEPGSQPGSSEPAAAEPAATPAG